MYRTIVVASIYEYTDKDKLFGMVIASLYDKFCEAYENNSLTEMFPTYEGQEIKKNLTFQRIFYGTSLPRCIWCVKGYKC